MHELNKWEKKIYWSEKIVEMDKMLLRVFIKLNICLYIYIYLFMKLSVDNFRSSKLSIPGFSWRI